LLTFIDDYSIRTWVYFLKKKSEVVDNFLMFKALVEKKYGKSIKCLQTDNGCKYFNHIFEEYQLQHFVPYYPQQNGVTERKNCTLKEMVNFMIHSKGFSP